MPFINDIPLLRRSSFLILSNKFKNLSVYRKQSQIPDAMVRIFAVSRLPCCQHIENFFCTLLYSAVWVSIPFAEHLLSGYDNIIDSILLLPSLSRALEPVSITWNGISLGLDYPIATRETCNLDSFSTLDHLISLVFLHVDVSTARLCPVNHLAPESDLRLSVLQKGSFCQLLLTHYLDSNVLQQPGALTSL